MTGGALPQIAFWFLIALIVYPYAVYPLLIRVLAKLFPRSTRDMPATADLPAVTLVISAYNEAAVIAAKLANALAIDYPHELLEIIVVSDASSDATDDIVTGIAARNLRVRLLRQNDRRGKSAGLNAAVAQARGAIVIFSDANAMYKADAVRELVRGFADPEVGYVVGAALYNAAQSKAAASEGTYWDMELRMKEAESRFSSVVGGDGAIYAIRRELFWNFRDDDLSDLANPLQIIAHGRRGVFNGRAVCFEDAGDAYEKEFRRKRRIVNRSLRAVLRYGRGLQWRRDARFVFALISHKVLRWFTAVFIAVAVSLNAVILALQPAPLYWLTFAGFVTSAALAGAGAVYARGVRRPPAVIYLAYYFYLVVVAAILGVWDELRGIRHATWDHIRKSA